MPSIFLPYHKDLNQLRNHLVFSKSSIATAESCTGGLLAALLTELSGSSDFYCGGVSCYANSAKTQLLGVPEALLQSAGAVSREVALFMAESVRRLLKVDFGLAITGIAGPNGGTRDKPVGTVWCGFATAESSQAWLFNLSGDRATIRQEAARLALEHVIQAFDHIFKKGNP